MPVDPGGPTVSSEGGLAPVTAAPAVPVQPSALTSVPLGPVGPAQYEWLVHFCSRPPGLAQPWSPDPAIASLIRNRGFTHHFGSAACAGSTLRCAAPDGRPG